jgi:hypothetical protein
MHIAIPIPTSSLPLSSFLLRCLSPRAITPIYISANAEFCNLKHLAYLVAGLRVRRLREAKRACAKALSER